MLCSKDSSCSAPTQTNHYSNSKTTLQHSSVHRRSHSHPTPNCKTAASKSPHCSTIVQNLKVRAQRRSHISIHGSMSYFILATIFLVVRLQSIKLGTKLGGHLVQKGLGRRNVDIFIFWESMMFIKGDERASSLSIH